MASIDTVLAASRAASEQLLADAEAMAAGWATPRAPGKWSPSQIVEHVARSYDGAVHMAAGQPSAFPRLPVLIHPFVRIVFRRLLRKGSFPNGRTTKAMNPLAGPSTLGDGRARLAAAHDRFEAACRDLAARGAPMRTTMFGAVPVEDFVRFLELHTGTTTANSALARLPRAPHSAASARTRFPGCVDHSPRLGVSRARQVRARPRVP